MEHIIDARSAHGVEPEFGYPAWGEDFLKNGPGEMPEMSAKSLRILAISQAGEMHAGAARRWKRIKPRIRGV